MKNKNIIIMMLLTVLVLAPTVLHAQTASEVDIILASDTVSAAKAAYFVLGAAGLMPSGQTGAEAERTAYNMASTNGWITASSNDAVTMKDTAFLVMKAFDIKGGLMYTLLGNPRYAYREMVYLRLITGRTDQDMAVTGPGLLLILDKTLSYAGGDK